MANTLVQFRVDENQRNTAALICEKLGMDIPTYLRTCLARLIQEQGIPFSMKLDAFTNNAGIAALHEASNASEKNGISEMSLEEINNEIYNARKESGI